MQVVDSKLVSGKKVLLRLDIDVPLRQAQGKLEVAEEFRLLFGLPTLKLCIEHGDKVIIIGHLGRPFTTAEDEKNGRPEELSARPVCNWLKEQLKIEIDFAEELEQADKSSAKVVMLENIRFFHGEIPGADYHASCTSKTCDIDFAKKLASLGDFYVNEAFASYNPAASTTILPTLLPHACGLRFAKEIEKLKEVRENPKKPFVVIMGGAKVADKLPVIDVLAKSADAVLVGGKLVSEIREQNLNLPKNVLVGMLSEGGLDIAPQTVEAWRSLISRAAMIVWNGPVGKFEDPENNQTKTLAEMVLDSKAEIVIGGGDSVTALGQYGLLKEAEEKAFVSTGGGAMLKFLANGTLPTIEALV